MVASNVDGNHGRGSNSYEDLIAWQRAMDLVDAVYALSAEWPSDERFGLISQVRRAAVSVPANIAEGQGRNGRGEFVQHLGIANASVYEVETLVRIAARQGHHQSNLDSGVIALAKETSRLINGLIRAIQSGRTTRI